VIFGWVTLGLALVAVKANATVLLDPDPESSTTHFGYTIAVTGDVDGDGHPDLAVGGPFQDGDFDNSNGGFGPPQNVGKVWLVNGLNLTVIRTLDDPQFQMEHGLKACSVMGPVSLPPARWTCPTLQPACKSQTSIATANKT
jgi:hypothetical protein